jgi:hypothetical protein
MIVHSFIHSSLAGQIAWRLKRFEEAKARQEAEAEALRIEQNVKDAAERDRRKAIRKSNKVKKERAMAVLRVLTKPDTLFI